MPEWKIMNFNDTKQNKYEPPYIIFHRQFNFWDGILKIAAFGEILKVEARSGLLEQNLNNDYWTKGKSPIPPGNYDLLLKWREPLPEQKKTMGSRSYIILPEIINSGDGVHYRKNIELHYDANFFEAPGTAGCIGILPRNVGIIKNEEFGMNAVKDFLDKIESASYKTIPLKVIYDNIKSNEPGLITGIPESELEPKPEPEPEELINLKELLKLDIKVAQGLKDLLNGKKIIKQNKKPDGEIIYRIEKE